MMLDIGIPQSPFVDQRKERESPSTKIYVNYKDYSHWMSYKNCLIKGSRGAGKSSILDVFNFETHWFNKGIIMPSNDHKKFFPDQPDIIGVLFKCEELEKNLWERWNKKYMKIDENCDAEILFATFINYYFIEKIINAIIQIRNEFDWTIDENDNISSLITELLNACFPNKQNQPYLYDHSLISLKNELHDIHFSIRQQIYSLIPYEHLAERFTIHSASSRIIEKSCKILISKLLKLKDTKFFLLIDDVDRLEPWQLKVINSLLTSIQAPCSFKLSCTGDYKTKLTTNSRTISNTELHISNLNDDSETANKRYSHQIDDLFNAIFNIRVSSYFGETKFDVREVFGSSPDLDKLLYDALNSSINPEIKEFLNEFKTFENKKIIHYWIDFKNILDTISQSHVRNKKYSQYSISSVFSALNYFKMEKSFNYSSYDMIKMISSGSPRHFLRICNEMWEDIYHSLVSKKFPIRNELQSRAIVSASENLFENIDNDKFDGSIATSSRVMCLRLSDLFTKMLSIESLKITPECLSIQIDESKFNKTELNTYQKIIDWLVMIEAIKTRRVNDNVIKIALNPMLTPKFCLPYRSPFSYSFSLPEPTIFLKMLISEDDIASKIIERIYFVRIKKEQTLTIF